MMLSMDDASARLLSPPAIVVRAGKSIESDPVDFAVDNRSHKYEMP